MECDNLVGRETRRRLEKNWDLANEKLGKLQQASLFETDGERKKRLQELINETQGDLAKYEEELKSLDDATKLKRWVIVLNGKTKEEANEILEILKNISKA